MRHRASAVCLFALAAAPMPAIAGPVRVTDIYASLPGADTAYHLDDQGNLTPFTPPVATFMQFFGSEFDRATGRLLFYGIFDNATRIGAVDADFDPASLTVVRDNMPANSGFVDVDPATGRVYWWQDGQILSALPADTGTPVVEAMGVPTPVQLEVDAAHGVYLAITGLNYDELATGPLDGTSSPTTVLPQLTNGQFTDVAIDPITGDFVWAENAVGGTTFTAAIIRTPNDLSDTRAVVSIDGSTAGGTVMYGIGVVDNQIAVCENVLSFGGAQNIRVRVYDSDTGSATLFADNLSELLLGIDLDYELDPVYEHPESLLVDAGETATFTVTSLDPAATFLWGLDGQPLADDGRISGATAGTLVIANAQPADIGQYACRVTDSSGTHQFSNTAILAVRPGATCVADVDGNGILNLDDINIFATEFLSGCP